MRKSGDMGLELGAAPGVFVRCVLICVSLDRYLTPRRRVSSTWLLYFNFPLWNTHQDWGLNFLFGKRCTCFRAEKINYQEGIKYGAFWKSHWTFESVSTCQSHHGGFSVLPETFPSLGSHDVCLSWFFTYVDIFFSFQAHFCTQGFGTVESSKDHRYFFLLNTYSSFKSHPKYYFFGKAFPGLLD